MPRQKSFPLPRIFVASTLVFALAATFLPTHAARRARAGVQKGQPDLVVKISGPAAASAGDDIGPMINTLARNIGAAAAPGTTGSLDPANGFMVDVVLSTDTNVPSGFATFSANFSEDVLLQGGRISNTIDLAAGASQSYPNLQGGNGKIPADTPPGPYYLCARIDPGAKVVESNEANNVTCVRIRIRRPRT